MLGQFSVGNRSTGPLSHNQILKTLFQLIKKKKRKIKLTHLQFS